MSNKAVSLVVVVCLVTIAQFCRASANSPSAVSSGRSNRKTSSLQKHSALEIYLPRKVAISDDIIRLGQVSIISGKESLVAKAGKIALGRISVPGQEIIVDRPTVLSRLACNGIPASKVTLTGAEKITVKQQQQIINGNKFVELARSFLKKKPSQSPICQWNPIRKPKDLIVPTTHKNIKLSPRLVKSNATNHAKVRIAVLADGEEIDVREVTFRLKYNCRTAVTLVDIPAGAVISSENVKIESTISSYPDTANWRPPYGLITKRRLRPNTVIRPGMVEYPEPPVLLKRNQNVVIRIDRLGLFVTATGKTIQEGKVGEYIKVRNVDSQRIILAKVNEDGTVEPVF